MLRASQDRIGIVEALALISVDHGGAEHAEKVWILAEGLVDASPTELTSDAQHWRERPMDACRRHFERSHPSTTLDEVRVPAARHRELGRQDRRARPERVAVNAVVCHQQRNLQPRALGELMSHG